MSELQRYYVCPEYGNFEKDEDGHWVKFDDVDQHIKELEAKVADLERMRNISNQLVETLSQSIEDNRPLLSLEREIIACEVESLKRIEQAITVIEE